MVGGPVYGREHEMVSSKLTVRFEVISLVESSQAMSIVSGLVVGKR